MQHIYFTTPLYYVNDEPHLGHAYTTTIADVLTRYHRLFGNRCLFLTGTDEHGQKIQTAAQTRCLSPKAHCDQMVLNFKKIWQELNIQPDIFYRTTDATHQQVVQDCLQHLYNKGDIYESTYHGWYAESEEIFYTEKELVDGKTPLGNSVCRIEENNYFFRMSKYQDTLIKHIENNPLFIQPTSRRNEILGFLNKPLHDLCISRPKSRLSWGIEIPFAPDYVTYVWFDALLNYAVAVGLRQQNRALEFATWWQPPAGAIHLIGKDILTTHAVYWTTMLLALEVALPKTIFAHGWWLTTDNEKMSKSKGDVIRPLDLKDIIGVEALRYFLLRDITFGNDAQFSKDLAISRTNTELANNLGNLVNRTGQLLEKYFASAIPPLHAPCEADQHLQTRIVELPKKVRDDIERLAPHAAIGNIVDLLTLTNKYLGDQAPWTTVKTDTAAAGNALRMALEALRMSAILLQPVMPDKMAELLQRLSTKSDAWDHLSCWPGLETGAPFIKGEPLFPRIDS